MKEVGVFQRAEFIKLRCAGGCGAEFEMSRSYYDYQRHKSKDRWRPTCGRRKCITRLATLRREVEKERREEGHLGPVVKFANSITERRLVVP